MNCSAFRLTGGVAERLFFRRMCWLTGLERTTIEDVRSTLTVPFTSVKTPDMVEVLVRYYAVRLSQLA
jgi:hypothetical protein